jgi:hypothetical protein
MNGLQITFDFKPTHLFDVGEEKKKTQKSIVTWQVGTILG